MSSQAYLIDTNIVIELEQNSAVQPAYSAFLSLTSKHHIDVFVHEAAKDDISRDRDIERRRISLSKLEKFQTLEKTRGLTESELSKDFGQLSRPNDVVDTVLLHTLKSNAVDFLISQDNGLHARARRHSRALGRRVLFIEDAVELLRTTYEPKTDLLHSVADVSAHIIPPNDNIFESLKADYSEFETWWRDTCVRQRRRCWIVDDEGIAGLLVRKDETSDDTDATLPGQKIFKICTFKVRPESRGSKIGELLLKKLFWYVQLNGYDVAYVTTFEKQASLIDLLEYYGFIHTYTNERGEFVYERQFSAEALTSDTDESDFDLARQNYPRFVYSARTEAFFIPIKEGYHDVLFPDLRKDGPQLSLFEGLAVNPEKKKPGNTIRKVYLCRSASNLGAPGSLLFFYKGKSNLEPSQEITTIGILESVSLADSPRELMRITGGRSVYSETQLIGWSPTNDRPVKVINFLLLGYFEPGVALADLESIGIVSGHPPQSISKLRHSHTVELLSQLDLGFKIIH